MIEEKSQTRQKIVRDPQALSSEYHKARKQLMLWSAILFIWSLIGIDLQKAQEAGGNAGALIKSIKSPQAVPWALLIMVAYFVFKLRIEWKQSNENRRQVREAKLDYYSACIVASAAVLLYLGQAISRVQFADSLKTGGAGWSVLVGVAAGATLSAAVYQILVEKRPNKLLIVIMIVEILAGTGGVFNARPIRWTFMLATFGVISAILLTAIINLWRKDQRRPAQ